MEWLEYLGFWTFGGSQRFDDDFEVQRWKDTLRELSTCRVVASGCAPGCRSQGLGFQATVWKKSENNRSTLIPKPKTLGPKP